MAGWGQHPQRPKPHKYKTSLSYRSCDLSPIVTYDEGTALVSSCWVHPQLSGTCSHQPVQGTGTHGTPLLRWENLGWVQFVWWQAQRSFHCCPLRPAFPLTLPLRCSLNYFHSGQLLFSLQWRQFCSDGAMRFTKYSEGLFLQGLQKACFICLASFILCCPWLCWTPNRYPALSAQISAEDLEATQSKSTCDTQSENCCSPAHTNEQKLKGTSHASWMPPSHTLKGFHLKI